MSQMARSCTRSLVTLVAEKALPLLVISVGTEWFSWSITSLSFVLQLTPANCAGAASLTSSLLLIFSVVCLISACTSVYRRITLILTFPVKPLISPSLCVCW